MAMIYCRECGYKHSDKARACPKCGATHEDIITRNVNQMFHNKSIIIYLLLAIFTGVLGFHRLYAGKRKSGLIMCAMGLIIFGICTNPMSYIYLGWLTVLLGIGMWAWYMYDLIFALCHLSTPEAIFNNNKK